MTRFDTEVKLNSDMACYDLGVLLMLIFKHYFKRFLIFHSTQVKALIKSSVSKTSQIFEKRILLVF